MFFQSGRFDRAVEEGVVTERGLKTRGFEEVFMHYILNGDLVCL